MPAQVISYIDPPGPWDDDRALDEIVSAHTSDLASQGARVNASRRVLGNTLPATLSEAKVSLALQVLGDSTGNEAGEWVDLLAQDIAARYPAYEVRQYSWDTDNQKMPRVPTVTQSPPLSSRRTVWPGVGGATRRFTGPAITGDLDVRVKVEMSNWVSGAAKVFACRFGDGTHRAWRLSASAAGYLTFDWTTDGSTIQTAANFGAWSMPTGAPVWIRVVLDVDNGASGHAISAYTSSNGTTWTSLGTFTRESTTSISNVDQIYEIGGRGTTSDLLDGTIYEVQILDGIDGYPVAPILPEHWLPSSNSAPDPIGSPIISIVNGSQPGAGVVTLDAGLVLENMTPNYGQVATIVSSSHNEAGYSGDPLYALWNAYCASIRARLPNVPILALTQNPRIDPAGNQYGQSARRRDYLSWEQPLAWTVIDTYEAFLADGRSLSDLIKVDGIHPNADGERVWANAVKAALGLA